MTRLINQAEIQIHCAYGSNKDMSVYSSVGLSSQQIFIVGKGTKKNQKEAQVRLSTQYTGSICLFRDTNAGVHLATSQLLDRAKGRSRLPIHMIFACFEIKMAENGRRSLDDCLGCKEVFGVAGITSL